MQHMTILSDGDRKNYFVLDDGTVAIHYRTDGLPPRPYDDYVQTNELFSLIEAHGIATHRIKSDDLTSMIITSPTLPLCDVTVYGGKVTDDAIKKKTPVSDGDISFIMKAASDVFSIVSALLGDRGIAISGVRLSFGRDRNGKILVTGDLDRDKLIKE